ncbi:MAG: hypothetical protein QM496_01515 [Verrucomicrobiota bacterium]
MNNGESRQESEESGTKGPAIGRAVKKGVRHALFPMLVLVVFSLIVDETYPFSDFPMYSRLPPNTEYYFFEDGNGDPLPVKACFGVSASAMKKMYEKRLRKVSEKRSLEAGYGIGGSELTAEDKAAVGDELLDYLLPMGETKSWWQKNRPEAIRLIRVDIRRTDAQGLIETPAVVVERRLEQGKS